MECLLEVMEQPAERVKFRTEVESNLKLKSIEELFQLGSRASLPATRITSGPGETTHEMFTFPVSPSQTAMPDDTVAFPKVRLVPKAAVESVRDRM